MNQLAGNNNNRRRRFNLERRLACRWFVAGLPTGRTKKVRPSLAPAYAQGFRIGWASRDGIISYR
jgi:hypothetical protein